MTIRQSKIYVWLRVLRVHQWSKNLLLFLPLFMAHQVGDYELIIKAGIGFVAFSCCASAIYILNDLLDLKADRLHPTKKYRPFASGALSIQQGLFLLPVPLLTGIFISTFALPGLFTIALIIYLVLATVYSLKLKQIPVLDVLTLAGLFSFRIIAGAIAVEIPMSSWLLAFAMFFFLSLAFMKRHTDFVYLLDEKINAYGRGYKPEDLILVQIFGICSGYISILIFVLYLNNDYLQTLYSAPSYLWAIAPLIFFWITRMWIITHRGDMHDDPVIFTLKDPVSYFVGIAIVSIFLLSSLLNPSTFFHSIIFTP